MAVFAAAISTLAQQTDNSSPPVDQALVAPASEAVPPPSAAPKRSAAELEKLAAPIALYSDPLIAVILPAAVYPVEIVQAARFVADTNNIPNLDGQPWDENVKAVARFPSVIQKMNTDLGRTVELGQAFLDQPQELMDAMQALRAQAQTVGTLQTTPQQIVVVTNAVVERTYESQIVYVTNTVIQIQPSDPQVIYVPVYSPTVVYAPPPTYVYSPVTPLITFGMGVAVGVIFSNNHCDWHYGGVYYGPSRVVIWGGSGYRPPYYPPPPGYRPPYYHPPPGYRPPYYPPGYRPPAYPPGYYAPRPIPYSGQKPPATTLPAQRWQPDSSRLRNTGVPSSPPSVNTLEARGWGSTGAATTRPAPNTGGSAPQIVRGGGTASAPPINRPPTAPNVSQPMASSQPVSRPTTTPNVSRPAPSTLPAGSGPSGNRQIQPSGSQGSAFGGMGNRATTRDSSNRGSASRSGNATVGGR
jgi:Protein of unknown function (DUF3300)